MTICFSFYFGTWFECWLGLVLVWPYKCGLIFIENTHQKFSNFETADRSVMARITNYPEVVCLLIGSLMIWHYLASTVAGMWCFVVERTIASFFFSDYERKPRSYIGYALLITSQFCVIQGSILIFFYFFSLKAALIIVTAMLTCVVSTFFFLLHYNTSLRNRLDIKQTNLSYNLAARFQAAENARSLKLAVFVFAVICCIFTIAISMLMMASLHWTPENYDVAIMTAFECLVSLNPLFIVPAAMFSVPEWKAAFIKLMPFGGRRYHRRRRPDSDIMDHQIRVSMETKMYFVQLEDSWKISIL
ncbi:hypothetical protein L5515_014963 [Caenorhabditis briggsae]|uniref:Uncharacterized protein n=1 Tax=Caenorhabditis briggsae TaxID=6238 RepID=A0AAE9EHI3_CAEBR|nr:hypothetical protein L5515_014963 [Caenorhabditis briggsae]